MTAPVRSASSRAAREPATSVIMPAITGEFDAEMSVAAS